MFKGKLSRWTECGGEVWPVQSQWRFLKLWAKFEREAPRSLGLALAGFVCPISAWA